ncbi:TIR domain-containing protein [Dactylosporangium sp. CS-033363]|uniref:TIR domain-containing protein n=1 Tax=Dactylosporangium sp. CS-033363 TaxID=3239935 RepID=UPI003D8F9D3E
MTDDGSAATPPAEQARRVFVVHGRNLPARDAMFAFLRALGLTPIEWSTAIGWTGSATPYIGDVLDTAFDRAQAVVVLMTPDEVAYLRPEYAHDELDPEIQAAAQARPNVLFEAGMAMGRNVKRTVLVELGQVRPFSDVGGRHAVRINDSAERRKDLAQRLLTAGCSVDMTGADWLSAGTFVVPPPPGRGLPMGRVVPKTGPRGVSIDAKFHNRGNGGRLEIINHGSVTIYDVNVEVPEMGGVWMHSGDLPVKRLPAGKSFQLPVSLTMGDRKSAFDVTVTGRTDAGEEIREEIFIDTMG